MITAGPFTLLSPVFRCLIYCLLLLVAEVYGFHQRLSEHELHHLFGVKAKKEIPAFVVNQPQKTYHADNGLVYSTEFHNQLYQFHLEPVTTLLAENFVAVERLHNQTKPLDFLSKAAKHCFYTGHSISHNGTRIALTGCGDKNHGLIQTADGQFIMITPLPAKFHGDVGSAQFTKSGHPHIIQKREAYHFVHNVASVQDMTEKVCLFGTEEHLSLLRQPLHAYQHDDPFPLSSHEQRETFAVIKGPLYVELGIFADNEMWRHFEDIYGSDTADVEILNFILAAVNNIHWLYNHPSLDPKVIMTITRYEVLKQAPDELVPANHFYGDVDLLLENFCEYQDAVNPGDDTDPHHWDHALLFSGYDLYRGALKSVAGYAPVKGMCSGLRSCTINEGLDFGAVFVITHEMGHSLGMFHDGDNGCSRSCCIMSPSVGAGKTSWSSCSNAEYNLFLNKLGSAFLPPNCLLDEPQASRLDHNRDGLPGQRYSLDQQCRVFHGDCWVHDLRDGQQLEDVCNMVWCGGGEGIIRTSHPAMEGSYCGAGKWCIEGKCREYGSFGPTPADGDWGAWNDSPKGSCGTPDCTPCQVLNQHRVKLSMRLCDHPAPNFGGKDCTGSRYRGILCAEERCTAGPTVSEFANLSCKKLRDDPDTPDALLTGQGLQYNDAPCKIWCHMVAQSFIRAIGNFPDGTPCGVNKFCVRGECQTLACDGKALVSDPANDCPSNEVTWASWSIWSICSRSCGIGLQSRARTCNGPRSRCAGTSQESRSCNQGPCVSEPAWSTWQEWRSCTVTCGGGTAVRQRECSGSHCDGTPFDFRPCALEACQEVTAWQSWTDWSTCSVSCNRGVQIRRRKCEAAVCLGRREGDNACSVLVAICDDGTKHTVKLPIESQNCNEQACNPIPLWGIWQSWGSCGASCGLGFRARTRNCLPNSAGCPGTSRDVERCYAGVCPLVADQPATTTASISSVVADEWSEWTEWSTCSRSCGNGVKFRRRVCASQRCNGRGVMFTNCNTDDCHDQDQIAASPLGSAPGKEFVARSLSGASEGSWLGWTAWSGCSSSCGQGIERRTRICEPRNLPCQGSSSDTQACAQEACNVRRTAPTLHNSALPLTTESTAAPPTVSTWGEWSVWYPPTCSCTAHKQLRARSCHMVRAPCVGEMRQFRVCTPVNCTNNRSSP